MQKQETIDKSIIILSLLAATLFAIVFYPSIKKLVAIWSTSEEYNHAFLTIPVIFYMIWTKRELLTPSNKISSITGFLLVGLVTDHILFCLADAGKYNNIHVHVYGNFGHHCLLI